MSTLLTLIGKDFRLFWADKVAVSLTFIVPIALISIFGLIFGGDDSGPSGVRVLVVDEAQSSASAQIIAALREESALRLVESYEVEEGGVPVRHPMSLEEARRRLATNASSYRFALVFPADFQREDFGFRLGYLYNPRSAVEYQIVTGLLQKTFFSEALPLLEDSFSQALVADVGAGTVREFQDEMAQLVSRTLGVPYEEVRGSFAEGSLFPDFGASGGGEAGDGAAGGGDPMGFLLDLEEEQIAGQGKPPMAQSVGGWAVMFLLFSMTGAASALFEEREAGIFHRLLAGPVSRSHVLWSKFAFLALLGLIQLTVLMAFGQWRYGIITSQGQILPLIAICAAGAAASTGFGMVLCAFSKTPAQANGFGTLLILAMSALGGAMFPSFMFPEWLRLYVSPLTLVHWIIDGILKVLWEDAGFAGLGLNLGILAGIALATLSVAHYQFKRGDLFR